MDSNTPLQDYLPALAAAQKHLKLAKVGLQWKDGRRRQANLALTEAVLLQEILEGFVAEPDLVGWRISWGPCDKYPFSKAWVDAVVTTEDPKALGRIDDREYKLTQDLEKTRISLFKNEGPLFREQFFGNGSEKAEVVIGRDTIEDRIQACVGALGLPVFREALLEGRLKEPSVSRSPRPRM